MAEENNEFDPNKTFEAAVERSKALEADIAVNPKKYREFKRNINRIKT